MQIHELNDYNGSLGAGAYLAVDNGNDTGKLSIEDLTEPLNTRIDNIVTSPAPTEQEIIDARLGNDGIIYPTLGDAIRGQVNDLSEKMTLYKSKNLVESDSDWSSGYVGLDGTVHAPDASLDYSAQISVLPGDVIRFYNLQNGQSVWQAHNMRFVTAYNSNNVAVSASGGNNVSTYTVPSGISSIIVTAYKGTQYMITRNETASAYEAYFTPYYVAQYDFIEQALKSYNVPGVDVKGFNLLETSDNGVGAYYASGSSIVFNSSYTSYHYAVMPVEENTDYYIRMPDYDSPIRWWILADDDDAVISSGTNLRLGILNTGNATKLYLTMSATYWAQNPIVAKGNGGVTAGQEKPDFLDGINSNIMDNKYGCAMPPFEIFATVGYPVVFYLKNILGLESNKFAIKQNSSFTNTGDGFRYNPPTPATNINGYGFRVYDSNYSLIQQLPNSFETVRAKNLSSCSALVIGDSTVAQNTMTQKMLDEFTADGKTLTLLGTQGTAPNLHEGRAGASTEEYATMASFDGYTNPFFNNGGFDFSYYMSSQGYGSVDFVVIQLGINDLYLADYETSQAKIEETFGYLKTIVDSIFAFNSSQKIIINLPTPPNADETYMNYNSRWQIANMYNRYNQYVMVRLDPNQNIHCSYCHLILDPSTDIADNIHPNASGYEKMALEVVSKINIFQNA